MHLSRLVAEDEASGNHHHQTPLTYCVWGRPDWVHGRFKMARDHGNTTVTAILLVPVVLAVIVCDSKSPARILGALSISGISAILDGRRHAMTRIVIDVEIYRSRTNHLMRALVCTCS